MENFNFDFNLSSFMPILTALLVVIAGAVIIKVILKIVGGALQKTKIDGAIHSFIKNVIKVLLWLVVIVTALGKLGIPTSTFVTVIGAGGAAIALALKDSLSNVAGGILILINKPFGKGDYISVAGTEGSVEEIDLLTTSLKTIDNKVVIIPNGSVSTSVLTNYSKEKLRRVDCLFGIGYDDDIDRAKEVLAEVAKSCPQALDTPATDIMVAEHGESAVILACRIWTKNSDYWTVKFFMEENVKKAFDTAGINIPYPQVDVHMAK